MYPNLTSKF